MMSDIDEQEPRMPHHTQLDKDVHAVMRRPEKFSRRDASAYGVDMDVEGAELQELDDQKELNLIRKPINRQTQLDEDDCAVMGRQPKGSERDASAHDIAMGDEAELQGLNDQKELSLIKRPKHRPPVQPIVTHNSKLEEPAVSVFSPLFEAMNTPFSARKEDAIVRSLRELEVPQKPGENTTLGKFAEEENSPDSPVHNDSPVSGLKQYVGQNDSLVSGHKQYTSFPSLSIRTTREQNGNEDVAGQSKASTESFVFTARHSAIDQGEFGRLVAARTNRNDSTDREKVSPKLTDLYGVDDNSDQMIGGDLYSELALNRRSPAKFPGEQWHAGGAEGGWAFFDTEQTVYNPRHRVLDATSFGAAPH